MTGEEEARQAPYAALVDTLFAAWDALTVFPAKSTSVEDVHQRVAWVRKEPLPQRAYLLFNRWEGNALAQQLEAAFPGWARDRFTVPDAYFEGREDAALKQLREPLPYGEPETHDVLRESRHTEITRQASAVVLNLTKLLKSADAIEKGVINFDDQLTRALARYGAYHDIGKAALQNILSVLLSSARKALPSPFSIPWTRFPWWN